MDQYDINLVFPVDGDVLDFIASMTGHVLSWPVAFVAAVLILRKPVKFFIENIKRLKGGGVDVETRDALNDAGTDALEAMRQSLLAEVRAAAVPASSGSGPAPEEDGQTAREDAPGETQPDATPVEGRITSWLPTLKTISSGVFDDELLWELGDPDMPVDYVTDPKKQMQWSWVELTKSLLRLYIEARIGRPMKRPVATVLASRLHDVGLVPSEFVSSVYKLRDVIGKVNRGQIEVTDAEARDFSRTARQLRLLAIDALPRAKKDLGLFERPLD